MTRFDRLLRRVKRGGRVYFKEEFYGGTVAIVRYPWLPLPGRRMSLTLEQVETLKAAVKNRRRGRPETPAVAASPSS
jgi:hypothetical protein